MAEEEEGITQSIKYLAMTQEISKMSAAVIEIKVSFLNKVFGHIYTRINSQKTIAAIIAAEMILSYNGKLTFWTTISPVNEGFAH